MIKKLIVVIGHAICYPLHDPMADVSWFMQPFQRGEQKYYIEHICAGIECLADGDDSILVFSGGRSRREAGPFSEAQGYWFIAKYYDLISEENMQRIFLEERSRDSFENVELSIDLFQKKFGYLPEQINVVGWKFKTERFYFHMETIRESLQWKGKFTYCGVNNPEKIPVAGEKRTLELFRRCPQGDTGRLLEKRTERGSWLDKCY